MAMIPSSYSLCEVVPPVLAKCPNCGYHPIRSGRDSRSSLGLYQSAYYCKACKCSFAIRYALPLSKYVMLMENVDEYGKAKDAYRHFGLPLIADDTLDKMQGASSTIKFDAVPDCLPVEPLVVLPRVQHMQPNLQERITNEGNPESARMRERHDSNASHDNQD